MAPPQAKKRVLLIGASERSGSGGSLEIPGTEWQKIHRWPMTEVASSPAISVHVSWRSSSTWPWWTARTEAHGVTVGPVELPTNHSKDTGTPLWLCQECCTIHCTTNFHGQKRWFEHVLKRWIFLGTLQESKVEGKGGFRRRTRKKKSKWAPCVDVETKIQTEDDEDVPRAYTIPQISTDAISATGVFRVHARCLARFREACPPGFLDLYSAAWLSNVVWVWQTLANLGFHGFSMGFSMQIIGLCRLSDVQFVLVLRASKAASVWAQDGREVHLGWGSWATFVAIPAQMMQILAMVQNHSQNWMVWFVITNLTSETCFFWVCTCFFCVPLLASMSLLLWQVKELNGDKKTASVKTMFSNNMDEIGFAARANGWKTRCLDFTWFYDGGNTAFVAPKTGRI